MHHRSNLFRPLGRFAGQAKLNTGPSLARFKKPRGWMPEIARAPVFLQRGRQLRRVLPPRTTASTVLCSPLLPARQEAAGLQYCSSESTVDSELRAVVGVLDLIDPNNPVLGCEGLLNVLKLKVLVPDLVSSRTVKPVAGNRHSSFTIRNMAGMTSRMNNRPSPRYYVLYHQPAKAVPYLLASMPLHLLSTHSTLSFFSF